MEDQENRAQAPLQKSPEAPPGRKAGRPKTNQPAPVYRAAPNHSELDPKKYDQLADWQKNLVFRLIEHGDLDRAAKETGVSRYVRDTVNTKIARINDIKRALYAVGITEGEIARHLKDCLHAVTTKVDHHGNPYQIIDHNLKLKAITLVCDLFRSAMEEEGKEKKVQSIVDLFKDIDESEKEKPA